MTFTHTFTADGQSGEFVADGPVRVHLKGTFGGGTINLQEKQVDDTFDSIVDSAKTADADYIFDLVTLSTLRLDISGSTTPSVQVEVKGNIVKPAV